MKRTKLTGLFLSNFQSIKEPTFISLTKLTLLYGPNSAGKSAVIDALRVLREAVARDSDTRQERTIALLDRWATALTDQTILGVEYTQGDPDEIPFTQILEWRSRKPDTDNADEAYRMHESIAGKPVQIEFLDRFEGIKVAIWTASVYSKFTQAD